jgi:hypothetical protein
MRFMLRSLTIACLAAPLLASGQSTLLTSKANGDDQFKMYLSTQPISEGLQWHNAYGWGVTYTNTLLLPQPTPNQNYKDYWLNIWVQDVGGGGPFLLGEFKLSGKPGCKFDNGSKVMVTGGLQSNGSSYWMVSPAQPWSGPGVTAAGYPTWVTNYLPPWVQPTLVPFDAGPNGIPPWGPMPQISSLAHWISDPGQTNTSEAWFSTHIRCK